MKPYNPKTYLFTFISIWTAWSFWNMAEPTININQLSVLFLILPLSVLCIAYCFFDKDKDDDDDFDDGILEPIYIISRKRRKTAG